MGHIEKDLMSDEEVALEIARLNESEAVNLAQKEQHWKNRRRQYLNTLSWYEKSSKELITAGVTENAFAASAEFCEMEGGEKSAGRCTADSLSNTQPGSHPRFCKV